MPLKINLDPDGFLISRCDLILLFVQELRSLRHLARNLPVARAVLESSGVVAAQNHDLLEQTLEELASFLEHTAAGFGDEPNAHVQWALSEVRLTALAKRLAGNWEPLGSSNGDLEYF